MNERLGRRNETPFEVLMKRAALLLVIVMAVLSAFLLWREFGINNVLYCFLFWWAVGQLAFFLWLRSQGMDASVFLLRAEETGDAFDNRAKEKFALAMTIVVPVAFVLIPFF